jgi:hypothetical protein
MAKIINKSGLNIGTELTVNTGTRIITLNIAGGLVAKDGVTWQALYSKLVQLWESATYNAYPFPFYTIDALSGQFNIGFDGTRYNTWTFAGTPTTGTRLYLRDGGWNEYTATTPGADGTSATGSVNSTYAGVVSLGTVSSLAQLYYQKDSATGTAIDFTYTDAANLGVQVFGDATHGNIVNANFLQGFCRVYGKKYSQSVLADTGKSATGAYLINLLLANSDDLDATGVYADIITTPVAPYNKMKINYFASAFIKNIDGVGTTGSINHYGIVVDVGTHSGVDGVSNGTTSFTTAAAGITGADFTGGTLVVHSGAGAGTYTISGTPAAGTVTTTTTIPAASGASFTLKPAIASTATLRQIYSFVQAKLLQPTTINAQSFSVIGKTASLLMNWTAKLVCGVYAPSNGAGGGTGVCVEGVTDAEINTIQFYDNGATLREYPYASAGVLNFSANLVGGWYVLYYSDLSVTNDWGTATAVVVRDKSNSNISGTIGSTAVSFNYDYTNQTEGGKRTGGTDTAVTLVAGKSGSAKPVVVATSAAGGLIASKSISITATAETDRAYQA